MIFPSKVNGIPCQVEVTTFKAEVPAQIWGPPEKCYPSEPAEIEFNILDRRGYKATWLERMLDKKEAQRIEEEIHLMYEAELYDY